MWKKEANKREEELRKELSEEKRAHYVTSYLKDKAMKSLDESNNLLNDQLNAIIVLKKKLSECEGVAEDRAKLIDELSAKNKALSEELKKAAPKTPEYCSCVDATIADLKKKIEEQESIIRERENTVNQRDAEICALKWQIDCDRETKAALNKTIDMLRVKVGALEAERDAKKPPLSNLGEAEKKYDLAREAPKFFAALFEVSNGGSADGE